jgi:Uma2 family endonuclease
VKAIMLDVPAALLEERRRTGADLRDEVWEGVLHMVPPPSAKHQMLSTDLVIVLGPLARARGFRPLMETGLFRAEDDYRVPDQMYARPDQIGERGVEGGAVLVVEIKSPGDETYEKLDWYAGTGVDSALVIDPDTRVAEVFVRQGDRMVPSTEPVTVIPALGVELVTVDGPRLRISWDGGSAEV